VAIPAVWTEVGGDRGGDACGDGPGEELSEISDDASELRKVLSEKRQREAAAMPEYEECFQGF
jgi:hypothetical protein